MPVLSLQNIALGKLSLKDVNKLHFSEKGIVNRTFMKYLEEADSPSMLKDSIAENKGHICLTRQFNVWHGMSIGPRKFRHKTLCKCLCPGTGSICSCECDSAIKMLIEFRESEVFRGYIPNQKKHKKARRFISKRTTIKSLVENQFQDPHPFKRL